MLLTVFVLLGLLAASLHGKVLPVILWHGMGDSAEGMGPLADAIRAAVPEALVHAVRVGKSPGDDRKRGYLDNATSQVAEVCTQLTADPALGGSPEGVTMIGFSQGGLLARALVHTCAGIRVRRLITWASPHQGIADLPPTWCARQPVWCSAARAAVRRGAYLPAVQRSIIQAAYVKDPAKLDAYLAGNLFLPVLNNERRDAAINATVRNQFARLERVVLVRHANDTVLSPRDTAWFSEPASRDGASTPVTNTTLWTRDTIGLRHLHEKGRLSFVDVPNDHMQFSIQQFLDVALLVIAPNDVKFVHQP
ncbi:Alpha/Beta hydrolase protein [Blastocladiella britannica]|nr:Alpha/Beta hydrolase protein [Blastocladiella britannica]